MPAIKENYRVASGHNKSETRPSRLARAKMPLAIAALAGVTLACMPLEGCTAGQDSVVTSLQLKFAGGVLCSDGKLAYEALHGGAQRKRLPTIVHCLLRQFEGHPAPPAASTAFVDYLKREGFYNVQSLGNEEATGYAGNEPGTRAGTRMLDFKLESQLPRVVQTSSGPVNVVTGEIFDSYYNGDRGVFGVNMNAAQVRRYERADPTGPN